MTDEQIKHMVNRFLGWRLPENFSPDAGISFKAQFNEHTPHPMKHQPSGTNLFDAQQAEAMVRYMAEGLPEKASPPLTIDATAATGQGNTAFGLPVKATEPHKCERCGHINRIGGGTVCYVCGGPLPEKTDWRNNIRGPDNDEGHS